MSGSSGKTEAKKNVVFFGYRQWAADIAKQLVERTYYGSRNWRLSHYFSVDGGILPGWDVKDHARDAKRQSFEICDFDRGKPSAAVLQVATATIAQAQPIAILAYGWSWLIPPCITDIAPVIILHPSPLPRYRGGSPIQHQILNGETESAVSLFWATEEIDAGPIIAQKRFSLSGTLDEIFKRIEEVGVELTLPVLDLLAAGAFVPGQKQNESEATEFRRRTPKDSEITPAEIAHKPAAYLADKIRCLAPPYPEAYMICGDGRKLVIEKAMVEKD